MLRKKKTLGLLMAIGLCLALLPAVVAAAGSADPSTEAAAQEDAYEITAAEELPAVSAEYVYTASTGAMLAGDSEDASGSDAKGEDASSTDASGSLLGDVNGDKVINTADLIRLMKYISGDRSVGDLSVTGDINGDKRVDARDLIQLMKYVNGQITSLR